MQQLRSHVRLYPVIVRPVFRVSLPPLWNRGGGKAVGFDGEVTSQSASRTAPLSRGARGAAQLLKPIVIARPVLRRKQKQNVIPSQ